MLKRVVKNIIHRLYRKIRKDKEEDMDKILWEERLMGIYR